LAESGIDKNLLNRINLVSEMTEDEFERADGRGRPRRHPKER
jgi:hypothetical protein